MSEYELIRTTRKTIALEVTCDGKVIVRAPKRMAKHEVEAFVARNQEWLNRALIRQKARLTTRPEPDELQRAALIARAKCELPKKVMYYAQRMHLYPTGLRITSARTRFGSCSAKNSICFSWRLMMYPEAAVEYVVVHELAHIAHKNHGAAFYALIERELPDYRARRAMLRD